VEQTILGKQTSIVYKRSDAADRKSTTREPYEVDLICARAKIVVVTYEAVCVTDVSANTYVRLLSVHGPTWVGR